MNFHGQPQAFKSDGVLLLSQCLNSDLDKHLSYEKTIKLMMGLSQRNVLRTMSIHFTILYQTSLILLPYLQCNAWSYVPLLHSITRIYILEKTTQLLQLQNNVEINTYLLLTEFEGCTLSYGPSFFLLDLWPKREACGP